MSDIDPMTLSKHHDMQRYDLPGDGEQYDLELLPLDDGGYVIYEDALAAVAAAEQRGYKRGEQDQIDMTRDWGLHQHEVGRLQGQRDALALVVAYLRDETQHPSIEAGVWAYGFAEVIEQRMFNGSVAIKGDSDE